MKNLPKKSELFLFYRYPIKYPLYASVAVNMIYSLRNCDWLSGISIINI